MQTTIHSILEQKLIREHAGTSSDRRVALEVARSLQKQLFFVEVEWGSQVLMDGVEDVYMFLDDPENNLAERAELPSGVVTMLTKCYSVTCGEEGMACYSQSCPSRVSTIYNPNLLALELSILTIGDGQIPTQSSGADCQSCQGRLDEGSSSPSIAGFTRFRD